MKKTKIINTLLALTMALTVAVSPSAVVKMKSDKAGVTSASAQTTTTTTQTTKESVTINSKTITEIADEGDTFYEPEPESIEVVDESTAYINDALTVYFTEDATQSEIDKTVDSLGGQVLGHAEYLNEYEISITRSTVEEITATCDELMKEDYVDFASCTLVTKLEDESIPDDPWSYSVNWRDNALETSYSYFSNWWVKATDLDKAWDYKDYFHHINVGIVDSGFDTEHEDLQDKITFPSKKEEKKNMPNGHGTHVAGIIGAVHDNKKGVSGVVDDCTMICTDWQADKDQGQRWFNEARIVTGFTKVVRAGAKVVNFSIGSAGSLKNGKTEKAKIVKNAEGKFFSYVTAKLIQRGYDFICCQSAGNGVEFDGVKYAVDASNNGLFCAITKKNAVKTVIGVKPQDILDRVIIVASAQFNGKNVYEQSYFSDGGEQVSICAPGSNVYSTYYSKTDDTFDYAYLSGTSMASPVVAGITALVWSVNPDLTGPQVKQIVCDEANTKYEVLDSTSETHLSEGPMRMVNALLAVEAAIRTLEPETTTETSTEISTEPESSTSVETSSSSQSVGPDGFYGSDSTEETVTRQSFFGILFHKLFK